MISGIYVIKNKINEKIYIGSSVNIKQRISAHKSLLKRNNHWNDHLQSSWDLYGEENFDFSILEETKKDELILLEREQFWVDYYKSATQECGYNFASNVERHSGWKQSEEAKIKIGEASRGRPRRRLTLDEKERIGQRTRGRSYEDLFGVEKAVNIKTHQSRCYDQKYGNDKAEELRASKRGSLEELYGLHKAKDIREKMSKNRIGKSFITDVGKESLRKSKLAEKNPMYIEVDQKTQQSIISEFQGIVTNDMIARHGISRYKIKQILKESGLWKTKMQLSK